MIGFDLLHVIPERVNNGCGRRSSITMSSAATTISQQRHQPWQKFVSTMSSIVYLFGRSAYIGNIQSVCIVVAISRSGSFMVDVKKRSKSGNFTYDYG